MDEIPESEREEIDQNIQAVLGSYLMMNAVPLPRRLGPAGPCQDRGRPGKPSRARHRGGRGTAHA